MLVSKQVELKFREIIVQIVQSYGRQKISKKQLKLKILKWLTKRQLHKGKRQRLLQINLLLKNSIKLPKKAVII